MLTDLIANVVFFLILIISIIIIFFSLKIVRMKSQCFTSFFYGVHGRFNSNASPTGNLCWKSFDMLLGDEECRWHNAFGFGFSFYVIGSFCAFSVARCAISLSYDVVSATRKRFKIFINFKRRMYCKVIYLFFFKTFFLFLI